MAHDDVDRTDTGVKSAVGKVGELAEIARATGREAALWAEVADGVHDRKAPVEIHGTAAQVSGARLQSCIAAVDLRARDTVAQRSRRRLLVSAPAPPGTPSAAHDRLIAVCHPVRRGPCTAFGSPAPLTTTPFDFTKTPVLGLANVGPPGYFVGRLHVHGRRRERVRRCLLAACRKRERCSLRWSGPSKPQVGSPSAAAQSPRSVRLGTIELGTQSGGWPQPVGDHGEHAVTKGWVCCAR